MVQLLHSRSLLNGALLRQLVIKRKRRRQEESLRCWRCLFGSQHPCLSVPRSHWYAHVKPSPRQCWHFGRSQDWWENFVLSSTWNEERWIQNSRMTWSTLEEVADALHPHLQHMDTNMTVAIPGFERIATAVWWLVNVASFHCLIEQFAVGPSTAAEVVIEVCLAMEKEMRRCTIYLGDAGKIGVSCLMMWGLKKNLCKNEK